MGFYLTDTAPAKAAQGRNTISGKYPARPILRRQGYAGQETHKGMAGILLIKYGNMTQREVAYRLGMKTVAGE